jgi:hypothetical protein
MDTLALLCNLHADGPATLQRLRRAGCESLAALRRLDPASLAERLEWNERTAERFLREAALLSQRAEHAESEVPGQSEPEFELESTLVEELDGESEESESADAEEEPEAEPEEEESGYAPPAERVAAVLGTWRELDTVAPTEDPGQFVIPRPVPAADGRLDAIRIECFSRALVERLGELGISTLGELVDASGLELARAIPLGLTRLKHVQYLAQRELERLATSEPAAARPLVHPRGFEPFTPPAAEPFETAGPFA